MDYRDNPDDRVWVSESKSADMLLKSNMKSCYAFLVWLRRAPPKKIANPGLELTAEGERGESFLNQ